MRIAIGLVGCLLSAGLASAQLAGREDRVAVPPTGDATASTPSLSRIDYFRQLLRMSPHEREQTLAREPESKQQALRTKLDEYSKLMEEEREARLRLVEIWYYLQPLLNLAPVQRADKLAAVPEAARPLIEERLKWWDLVPQEHRGAFLQNELAIQYFVRLESSTPAQRDQLAAKPAEEWKALEETLREWRARPHEERQKMYQRFQDFFELPDKEKDKTLHALSDAERQKLERSLQTFEKLPPHQRAMCIASFRKFESMSKEDRDQFFKNVERWQDMTPRDRQNWINLMNLLPAQSGPPLPNQSPSRLPPGVGQGTPPKAMPKLPGAK